jgi:hypothetical protein
MDVRTHAPDTPLVWFRGEIVAVAGATRCYLVADDLDPSACWFVAVMCLCRREVDEGRLAGPFTSALAECWARRVLIAPEACVSGDESDEELADRLGVPVEQVMLARLELGATTTCGASHEPESSRT